MNRGSNPAVYGDAVNESRDTAEGALTDPGPGPSFGLTRPCNSIAIGWALQVEGGNQRMMDSHNKVLK